MLTSFPSKSATILLCFVIVAGQLRAAVPAVAGGDSHSVFLKSDGTAWVAGFYYNNPVKLNKGEGRMPVPVMSGIQAISAGANHTLFLKEDGTVWAEGINRFGQLGDGTRQDRAAPVMVMVGVKEISAGGFHSFFLKTDHALWASGRNFDAQLADGTKTDRPAPVKVMEGLASVSGGWFHSLFLKMDGTVMAMGDNSSGQLGNGSSLDPSAPSTVLLPGVASVTAGGDHSLFLKMDGTAWATGWNSSGQLGNGTVMSRHTPVQILPDVRTMAASTTHSLFLDLSGTVLATGDNEFGKLGDGTTSNRRTPVPTMTGVQAIAAARSHSLFLKTDGTFMAAGLVNGETTPLAVPVNLAPDAGLGWRQANFGAEAGDPAIAGSQADPDGDGLVNLLERAFNLPPRQPGQPQLSPEAGDAGLPVITLVSNFLQGDALRLQYLRRKATTNSGLIYQVEFTSDPRLAEGWNPYQGAEEVQSINETWQRVTVLDPARSTTTPARFARVRITTFP